MAEDKAPGRAALGGPNAPPGDDEHHSEPAPKPTAALPTLSEVVDSLESPASEYATWEELCEPGGRQKDYVLANGKRVRYTTFVPLETVANLRMRAMIGGRFDNARFSALMLKEVLVRPRIENDDQLRIALKADGMAMLDILADVQGLNRVLREQTEDSLGE